LISAQKNKKNMEESFLVNLVCIVTVALLAFAYAIIVFHIWRRFIQRVPVTERDEEESAAQLCYMCCERKADIILLACGHRGQCHLCTRRLLGTDRRCPMCRATVIGVIFLTA
jgi:hypothetical protein